MLWPCLGAVKIPGSSISRKFQEAVHVSIRSIHQSSEYTVECPSIRRLHGAEHFVIKQLILLSVTRQVNFNSEKGMMLDLPTKPHLGRIESVSRQVNFNSEKHDVRTNDCKVASGSHRVGLKTLF